MRSISISISISISLTLPLTLPPHAETRLFLDLFKDNAMLSRNAPAAVLLQLAIGVSRLTRVTSDLDTYLAWLQLAVSKYGPMHMQRMAKGEGVGVW